MNSTRKHKILLVEDEKPLLAALGAKFNKEDFEVLKALNGKEGLAVALKEHPDIILLDQLMPVENGLDMMKELRQDAWGQGAKVVMLTNLDDPKTMLGALTAGVPDVLIKIDWELKDVVSEVKRLLDIT